MGTTGESPTLNWGRAQTASSKKWPKIKNKCTCIAGTGSNNTATFCHGTCRSGRRGCGAAGGPLLQWSQFPGNSKEYVAPALQFPSLDIIPYVIPGRTGAQLLPEDLAILAENFENVRTVKEATGSLDNMRKPEKCCGSDYVILSGDDGYHIQNDDRSGHQGAGVISVVSNIAPKSVTEMVALLVKGETAEAEKRFQALAPLFNLVTVKTREKTPYGEVDCRARNPLALKTLMNILGMPSGPCRRPLGKMMKNGVDTVLAAVRQTQASHPEILAPVANFFIVDIDKRINTPALRGAVLFGSY
ncbi:MAG: dihydrodipicolinate synthase family protein [Desulfobacterales bacterium]